MVFPVVMYECELDHKESWAPKNWCFWTMVLEKTLESPLDCKEIKPVNPERNQSWIFIGSTDAEAETPILWPLDAKNWLTKKTLMLGKIEGRRRRGRQRMRWLDGITDSVDMSLSKSRRWWRTRKPGVLQSTGLQRVRQNFSQSVQSLSRVRLFATPWTAACQASLSIIKSQSLPKLMSIESVMLSNHLILCHPLLLPP